MITWTNGASGKEIKSIIDQNFKTVSMHLTDNVLTLSTIEREALNSNYLSEGLRVFDKTLEKWFKYTGHSWVECPYEYIYTFSKGAWNENIIMIPFSIHNIKNPITQLFIKNENGYSSVVGGVTVDGSFNVLLYSDLPFDGRVVVK